MTSRILLVDDNHIQSATRRAILEGSGREVCIALEGKRALELLSDTGKLPSGLIVTDHLMPVMSGPEFVTEVPPARFLPCLSSCLAACPMPN